jgi:dipeptidyl aminopeptidase/acylaminoacyl peptidase
LHFKPVSKPIRIKTTPSDAVVTIDGKPLKRDANGNAVANLSFPPDSSGTLKVYEAMVSKKTPDAEWVPQLIKIPYENGKQDYSVTLREIRTRPLPLLSFAPTRADGGWKILPSHESSVAGKDIDEGPQKTPQRLTPKAVKGQVIDSMTVSPDGKRLIFSVLLEEPDFHSVIYSIDTDGTGVPVQLTDGKSLDVTPAFSPSGDEILFASDRAGAHMSIWSMAADKNWGMRQYTQGDTNDLWPSMDSDPHPRVFCESYSDRLNKPLLFSTEVQTRARSDLGVDGGLQPRINAKNDAVLFTMYNEKGKRDIYKISDRGGNPINLTNTPDIDECDAAWDRDGARIVFASDGGVDAEEKKHNYDIWYIDTTEQNASPIRVTSNPSQDDHPVWDPRGRFIYFRSNRGVEWGIWKIALN